jgi:hypothetical protein
MQVAARALLEQPLQLDCLLGRFEYDFSLPSPRCYANEVWYAPTGFVPKELEGQNEGKAYYGSLRIRGFINN